MKPTPKRASCYERIGRLWVSSTDPKSTCCDAGTYRRYGREICGRCGEFCETMPRCDYPRPAGPSISREELADRLAQKIVEEEEKRDVFSQRIEMHGAGNGVLSNQDSSMERLERSIRAAQQKSNEAAETPGLLRKIVKWLDAIFNT